ncbi:acyl-CoA dehydrogenase family protein [Chloroflexota bacterium]
MDFALSEEQEMVKNMARDFFTDKVPRAVILELEQSDTGNSSEIWAEIAELGWMGLSLPEQFGGSGESFLTLGVLLEEMGRSAFISPYFSTIVLGGLPIMDAGTDEQQQRYLPGIAAGKTIFTLALTEQNTRYGTASVNLEAEKGSDNYLLNGTKLFVPNANIADHLICAAKTSEAGITLFIVDTTNPGITCTELNTISGDKLFEVDFQKVSVSIENVLGQVDTGQELLLSIFRRAAVAECCQMVGGMQKVLEMTIDYTKDRVQYGHPIGSFQAIQHFLANMAIDIDGARFTSYNAAWMMSQNIPCGKEVAVAKAWTSQTYRRIVRVAHQIHGALGFTVDHDLQFYFRRAQAAAPTFGDTRYYEQEIGRQIVP